jgi:glycosyltransferase involved in cell wall biosynthesis
MKLAIVIPAYNTRPKIATVVQRSIVVTPNVLVVDDGSRDGTAEEARKAGASVVRSPCNFGVGYATDRGIREVFRKGAEFVVTLDSDGSHDPSEIPRMIRALAKQRAHICLGNRLKSPRQTLPFTKLASNKFAASLLNASLDRSFDDVACGFRLFDCKYLLMRPRFARYGYLYEIIFLACRRKLKIVECPVSVKYDASNPLLTKRRELSDFLQAVSYYSKKRTIKNIATRLRKRIGKFGSFQVSLLGERFAAFPIKEFDSYMFQVLDEVEG